MQSTYVLGAISALSLLASATPAMADMAIATGNNPQPDENVLMNPAQGNLIVGSLNQSGAGVNLLGNEALSAPSSGQARVEGADGGITFLNVSLADATRGFTSLILNLNASEDGSATFTATNQLGETLENTFAIDGNGENFFTLTAFNGQIFHDVSVLATVDLDDIRQIRVGGVTLLSVVPEPATWGMMILGLGAVGAAMRRRRQFVRFNFA